MIESMVKAMVSEYTPQAHAPAPLPVIETAVAAQRPSLVRKIVTYRI
jgi:hypothetical protein